MKKIAIYALLVIGMITSCKDKEPVLPKPDPSNNEYTVKVKIINGTTGKTLYTTSKMHLRIERKYGLGHIDDELLGSAYMDEDGGIEITYKHSATGAMSGATAILYGGPWAVGFNLPPNQNVDTSIYRSTWGGGVIFFESENPIQENDTFFLALVDSVYAFKGPMKKNEKRQFKCRNIKTNYYTFWAIGIEQFNLTRTPIPSNRKIDYIPTGDPFQDTIRILY